MRGRFNVASLITLFAPCHAHFRTIWTHSAKRPRRATAASWSTGAWLWRRASGGRWPPSNSCFCACSQPVCLRVRRGMCLCSCLWRVRRWVSGWKECFAKNLTKNGAFCLRSLSDFQLRNMLRINEMACGVKKWKRGESRVALNKSNILKSWIWDHFVNVAATFYWKSFWEKENNNRMSEKHELRANDLESKQKWTLHMYHTCIFSRRCLTAYWHSTWYRE